MTCKRLRHRSNTLADARTALREGFHGVEIDVVRGAGTLVVAHDQESAQDAFTLSEYLDSLPAHFSVAINVKEYFCCSLLQQVLSDTLPGVPLDYFIFDAPGPELEEYRRSGLRYFGRVSELELQESPHGLLVDSYSSDPTWVRSIVVGMDSPSKKSAALISPTLRGQLQFDHELTDLFGYLITK